MTDAAFAPASALVAALREGSLSSTEVTETCIERIERLDGAINAVVVRCFEQARSDARAADATRAAGKLLGPLHGLPMTIKEAYDLAGTATTWGIPEYAGNVASSDAEAVRRLRAAGAHILGKTNVPLALADFQSYNDIYGQTNNPWDVTRTPGGSSGGSSAALAAGFTPLEIGSDIGGSIRNPAHYCGVYGHKPTWGIVPDRGHALPGTAAPADLAVCGPLARSAEDLALALDLLAGPDARQERGWTLALPRPSKTRLADFRVAVWPQADFAPVAAAVAARVQDVADVLARAGATVSDRARPAIDVDRALDTYYALLWGVIGAGVPDVVHETRKHEALGFAPSDRSPRARAVRNAVQDQRTWMQHHQRRYHLRDAWNAFFEQWDILICPQMPTTAFAHDHAPPTEREILIDERRHPYLEQLHWAGLITVAHLPSTVFPTGPATDGLPLGLQAVGREYDDFVTIDFCRLLAAEIGGFVPPPDYA